MSPADDETAHTTIVLTNPSDDEIARLSDRFDLHPLIADDLRAGRQHPKFERPGEHLYLYLWDMNAAQAEDGPATQTELAVIFDDEVLLLIQRGEAGQLRDLNAALAGPGMISVRSTISAVYRVIDTIVADFVALGAVIERELDSVEDEVFDSNVHEDYRRIYRLRGRIGQIDRAASGLAEVLRSARREIQALTDSEPDLRPYFTHLEHDAIGAAHLASTEHKELDAVVASHESNVSTRQNQDMRTISAYAALLAIPTVVAGIYGMNFDNLPLLHWKYGWATVMTVTAGLDVVTYLVFRRRGWLGGAPATRNDGERSDQK